MTLQKNNVKLIRILFTVKIRDK